MKKIVLFVLVIALCGVGITAAALIAKARTEAIATTKVNTPTNTEDNGVVEGGNSEPTTTEPVTTQEQEVPIPTVYGQDVFSTGTLVATQDDLQRHYVCKNEGQSNMISMFVLGIGTLKPHTTYGVVFAINPHAFDIERVFLPLYYDDYQIALWVGDVPYDESDYHFNPVYFSSDNDIQSYLTNSFTFTTGEFGGVSIGFLWLSNTTHEESDRLRHQILSNVTCSLFELPAE